VGVLWHALFIGLGFTVKNQQRIHLSQRPRGGRQRYAVWGGNLNAPVIDGRLDIGNVNARHGNLLKEQRS
jgi:hypothetical protein